MPNDRPVTKVEEIRQSEPIPEPIPELEVRQSAAQYQSLPLGWDAAVRAAGDFLGEQFAPPNSCADPAMADMAQDLAARLCAYDEIAEVVERMSPYLPTVRSQTKAASDR